MTRKYVKVKYLLAEVLKHKQDGKTHSEIAEIYGLSKDQVKKLVERNRQAERKAKEELPKFNPRRGRPRKTPLTSQKKLELENKQLRMENELLRSFLQAAGRGRDQE